MSRDVDEPTAASSASPRIFPACVWGGDEGSAKSEGLSPHPSPRTDVLAAMEHLLHDSQAQRVVVHHKDTQARGKHRGRGCGVLLHVFGPSRDRGRLFTRHVSRDV